MQKGILTVEYTDKEMYFLLNCPSRSDVPNPLKEWLPDLVWYSMQKLIEIEGFEQFAQNVEKEAPNRFKDWYNELSPEEEKLPLDWKKLEQMPFQKMLVVRVIRPDRVINSIKNFIIDKMNDYYVKSPPISFMKIYEGSTCKTPIVFILSPGADPFSDVSLLVDSTGLG
jgi:dynein heavy chain